MDIQVLIPPALCAIHNVIHRYDPDEIDDYGEDVTDMQLGVCDDGELSHCLPSRTVREQANARRDQIAEQMWADYQSLLRARDDSMEP